MAMTSDEDDDFAELDDIGNYIENETVRKLSAIFPNYPHSMLEDVFGSLYKVGMDLNNIVMRCANELVSATEDQAIAAQLQMKENDRTLMEMNGVIRNRYRKVHHEPTLRRDARLKVKTGHADVKANITKEDVPHSEEKSGKIRSELQKNGKEDKNTALPTNLRFTDKSQHFEKDSKKIRQDSESLNDARRSFVAHDHDYVAESPMSPDSSPMPLPSKGPITPPGSPGAQAWFGAESSFMGECSDWSMGFAEMELYEEAQLINAKIKGFGINYILMLLERHYDNHERVQLVINDLAHLSGRIEHLKPTWSPASKIGPAGTMALRRSQPVSASQGSANLKKKYVPNQVVYVCINSRQNAAPKTFPAEKRNNSLGNRPQSIANGKTKRIGKQTVSCNATKKRAVSSKQQDSTVDDLILSSEQVFGTLVAISKKQNLVTSSSVKHDGQDPRKSTGKAAVKILQIDQSSTEPGTSKSRRFAVNGKVLKNSNVYDVSEALNFGMPKKRHLGEAVPKDETSNKFCKKQVKLP